MPKQNDRNQVVLGPARIKVEDEVLQVADQGLIAPATTTPPGGGGGGETPVGPPGDLITPPAVDAVAGYPILNPQLLEDTSADLRNAGLTGWAIIDGTSFGWFARSLILPRRTNSPTPGVTGTRVVNLDNPGQTFDYLPSSSALPYSDPIVYTEGIISGNYIWDGSSWQVLPNQVLNLGGATLTVPFNLAVNGLGFSNAGDPEYEKNGYRYFFLRCQLSVSPFNVHALFRVPTSGSFSLELVAGPFSGGGSSFGSITLSTARFLGVEAQYAYVITYQASGGGGSPWRAVWRIDTNSNTITQVGSNYNTPTYPPLSWVLVDGSLASLLSTPSAGYHPLQITFPDGSTLNQATFMTTAEYTRFFGGSNAPVNKRWLAVPGAGTSVSFFLDADSATKGLQMTGQGYQTFTMPSYAQGSLYYLSPRWAPGFSGDRLRWIGSPTAGEITTNGGLYEGPVG